MTSLYAQYISEREGLHIIEEEHGYATYSFEPEGVYIRDIFVEKDFRHDLIASGMANKIASIAKAKGLKYLYGSVVPTANFSTSSLKVLLAYGMQLDSCTNNFILMKKEI